MKRLISTILFPLILSFFLRNLSAQSINVDTYTKVPDLKFVDSININQIGFGFGVSTGTHGHGIHLFPDGSYKQTESDCQLSIETGNGYYSFVGKQLILNSKNEKTIFDIFLFDKRYFFIFPSQRKSFISYLKKLQIKYPNGNLPRPGSKISSNDMIAYILGRKYYCSNKR